MKLNASPQRLRLQDAVKLAVFRPPVKHADAAEDIHEVSRRLDVLGDKFQVALHEREEGIGTPAIGLSLSPLIEPSANGIAIRHEANVAIRVTFGVWVEVNVVVVGRKQNAVAVADFNHLDKIFKSAELRDLEGKCPATCNRNPNAANCGR